MAILPGAKVIVNDGYCEAQVSSWLRLLLYAFKKTYDIKWYQWPYVIVMITVVSIAAKFGWWEWPKPYSEST